MKNKWYESVGNIAACTLALAFFVVLGFNGSAADAQEASQRNGTKERIDAPVTHANSVLVSFEESPTEHGPTLRMPKMLFSASVIPNDPKQPIRTDTVEMTFFYPDMTLTNLWAPEIPRQPYRIYNPNYNPQTDRFWVHMLWMFYSPPDADTFVLGSEQPRHWGPDPRPPRIELNRHCYRFVNGHCNFPMRRVPSGIKGIIALHAEDWIETHPEAAIHHPEKGGVYVESMNSPYELVMDCDAFTSLRCLAFVYSKKYHFQYRMEFPPEAVGRTDELIRKIDTMLGQWSIK
jgi:hypothetical protein